MTAPRYNPASQRQVIAKGGLATQPHAEQQETHNQVAPSDGASDAMRLSGSHLRESGVHQGEVTVHVASGATAFAKAVDDRSVARRKLGVQGTSGYVGLGLLVAMIGGFLGVLGAVAQEAQAFGLLAVIFAAPLIEEATKPSGIYVILTVWPRALFGRLHTACLTAVSGLCFALIESLIYVTVYFPDHGDDYVLFRFTVPVAMHVLCSFVMGLGLDRGIVDWAAGHSGFPGRMRNFYLVAAGLHAAYNSLALVVEVADWWDFGT